MILLESLIEKVRSYNPGADLSIIEKAYKFSEKAHINQTRDSGDPYFSHPVGVAYILAQFNLDLDSIATALLHDTIEDTLVTLEAIEEEFGPKIAKLVDGITKLSRIGFQSAESKQAENFRKLVVAMSEDIRVLVVKLADRLHNMQTLGFIQSIEKRKRIARETLEIYAPLADRIGMQALKDELEDRSFAEINSEAHSSILTRLKFLRNQEGRLVESVIDELTHLFAKHGLKVDISGREKSPYSIWQKMQRKNIGFEQLSDIMAFRIVVEDLAACYHCLGLIHSAYPVIPGRFKDYISTPKPNNYRSLHTCILGPSKQRIEIQIRTNDMHEIAEYGVAAHWQYKQDHSTEGKEFKWLRGLLDILENTSGAEEFLEHTRLEMFHDQVFCFTPKGDLIALPRGSTCVDFAYAVHSEVGDRCIGAKINGRMMPLRSILSNGDQVEVITSKTQNPSPSWDRFVVTGKARACIRRFVRSQQRSQYLLLGKTMLQKAFKQHGKDLSDKLLDPAVKALKFPTSEDLYIALGEGQITGRDVFTSVFPDEKPNPDDFTIPTVVPSREKNQDNSVPIHGLIPGMAIHYAGCCHPLPGDRIVGIVTTGKGVTIHTFDCDNLANYHDKPERWIDVSWNSDQVGQEHHIGRMTMVTLNSPGGLANISTIIVKNAANIVNLKIIHRTSEFCDMTIDIEVKNGHHLDTVIAALRASPFIISIDRMRN
ncbi:MAG: bifunctional (p)ppGpp synthetase/guanosine-3',5'-bis(diphosphate) 3'-pyrophosphohydrolase [Alphaproteobacteria bacterium]|nr:bifunctional (p)ppGpp synthetase/guanosine-3',5'-bis(diphosphate) 3'-pyrophosphohydrolase [Alphaproteobacteria bacterium]OJV47664.1 MAG: bifunctional (p)ppGpp synthetase/guanosine-3',5'-bis(diphosphate) 3'-pyrophosphohydrolase [Alphaproteobacteria bacterium 43-37]